MKVPVLTPSDFDKEVKGVPVYLMGPVVDAPDWHTNIRKKMAEVIAEVEKECSIITPISSFLFELSPNEIREYFVTNYRWVNHAFAHALQFGVCVFFIPRRVRYSQTAYATVARIQLSQAIIHHHLYGSPIIVMVEDSKELLDEYTLGNLEEYECIHVVENIDDMLARIESSVRHRREMVENTMDKYQKSQLVYRAVFSPTKDSAMSE